MLSTQSCTALVYCKAYTCMFLFSALYLFLLKYYQRVTILFISQILARTRTRNTTYTRYSNCTDALDRHVLQIITHHIFFSVAVYYNNIITLSLNKVIKKNISVYLIVHLFSRHCIRHCVAILLLAGCLTDAACVMRLKDRNTKTHAKRIKLDLTQTETLSV